MDIYSGAILISLIIYIAVGNYVVCKPLAFWKACVLYT